MAKAAHGRIGREVRNTRIVRKFAEILTTALQPMLQRHH
jgi:hypothetical protein